MSTFKSTWQNPLPEDEIGRQQEMKERLTPGVKVILNMDGIELGEFIYSGLWDTMHSFYPHESTGRLGNILPSERHRYLKRDLMGREYLSLPYTILADVVRQILRRSDL